MVPAVWISAMTQDSTPASWVTIHGKSPLIAKIAGMPAKAKAPI